MQFEQKDKAPSEDDERRQAYTYEYVFYLHLLSWFATCG